MGADPLVKGQPRERREKPDVEGLPTAVVLIKNAAVQGPHGAQARAGPHPEAQLAAARRELLQGAPPGAAVLRCDRRPAVRVVALRGGPADAAAPRALQELRDPMGVGMEHAEGPAVAAALVVEEPLERALAVVVRCVACVGGRWVEDRAERLG